MIHEHIVIIIMCVLVQDTLFRISYILRAQPQTILYNMHAYIIFMPLTFILFDFRLFYKLTRGGIE